MEIQITLVRISRKICLRITTVFEGIKTTATSKISPTKRLFLFNRLIITRTIIKTCFRWETTINKTPTTPMPIIILIRIITIKSATQHNQQRTQTSSKQEMATRIVAME